MDIVFITAHKYYKGRILFQYTISIFPLLIPLNGLVSSVYDLQHFSILSRSYTLGVRTGMAALYLHHSVYFSIWTEGLGKRGIKVSRIGHLRAVAKLKKTIADAIVKRT